MGEGLVSPASQRAAFWDAPLARLPSWQGVNTSDNTKGKEQRVWRAPQGQMVEASAAVWMTQGFGEMTIFSICPVLGLSTQGLFPAPVTSNRIKGNFWWGPHCLAGGILVFLTRNPIPRPLQWRRGVPGTGLPGSQRETSLAIPTQASSLARDSSIAS